MSESGALLRVCGLTRRFGGVVAVNEVDLHVDPGEVVGLIGPNGAGKTTLFNMVTGFLRPTAGRVHFRGIDITSTPPHRRAMLGIVCTFQKTAVFPNVTVAQAVRIGQHRVTRSNAFDALFGTQRHRREETETATRATGLLDLLGLSGCAGERAGSLSYGQQRLVELAIALAAKPELLLLDEPAAGLNRGVRGAGRGDSARAGSWRNRVSGGARHERDHVRLRPDLRDRQRQQDRRGVSASNSGKSRRHRSISGTARCCSLNRSVQVTGVCRCCAGFRCRSQRDNL